MTATPPLPAVIAELITSPTKVSRELSRGLVLAYTPGDANVREPGAHRLTLSRRGQWPSEREVETVKRDLLVALRGNGRAPGRVCVEWWRGKRRGYWYHVLFWREAVQGALL